MEKSWNWHGKFWFFSIQMRLFGDRCVVILQNLTNHFTMYQAKQKNWQAMKLKTSHLEECISWYFKILRKSSGINFVTYSFKTVTQMYFKRVLSRRLRIQTRIFVAVAELLALSVYVIKINNHFKHGIYTFRVATVHLFRSTRLFCLLQGGEIFLWHFFFCWLKHVRGPWIGFFATIGNVYISVNTLTLPLHWINRC